MGLWLVGLSRKVYGCLEWFSIRGRCLSLSLIGNRSHILWVFRGWLFLSLCLFAQDKAVWVFMLRLLFCIVRVYLLLNMYRNNHAAFWSASPSPEESPNTNNQSQTTVHYYFKTWRSVTPENVFKCCRKNHQALWWNWLSWRQPQEGRPRISSAAEDKLVTSLRYCSPK